jgi:hypothetical protein
VKLSRVTAIAVICVATASACGAAQSTSTLAPLVTPAATPIVTPAATPTAAPTAAPTVQFALTDTVVVGTSKLTVSKVVINAAAVSKLATASEMFHTAVGDFRFGTSGGVATPGSTITLGQGWIPVGPDRNPPAGDLLGIRASVASGSAEALAGLAVTATSGARGPATVVASAWSDDGKSVMWFFAIPSASAGPFVLNFPSGETVDLGTPASS